MLTWAIIAVVLAVFAFAIWDERRAWRWLRGRCCHRELWLRAVPVERRSDLADFLTGIANAWLVPRSRVFALRPSDDLQEIYAHVYRFGPADSLEHVNLATHLEEFGLSGDLAGEPVLRVGDLVRKWIAESGISKPPNEPVEPTAGGPDNFPEMA